MRAVVCDSLVVELTCRPGTSNCTSLMSVTPVSCSSCSGSAVIMIGTSCMTSSRFCAVTVMVASVTGSLLSVRCLSGSFDPVASWAPATEIVDIDRHAANTAAASVWRCGWLLAMFSPYILMDG